MCLHSLCFIWWFNIWNIFWANKIYRKPYIKLACVIKKMTHPHFEQYTKTNIFFLVHTAKIAKPSIWIKLKPVIYICDCLAAKNERKCLAIRHDIETNNFCYTFWCVMRIHWKCDIKSKWILVIWRWKTSAVKIHFITIEAKISQNKILVSTNSKSNTTKWNHQWWMLHYSTRKINWLHLY